MAPPPRPVQEEEEIDEEEFDECPDMFEALGSLLATEEGETIADIAKRQADAAEKIALNIEMQNKILIKILTALSKKAETDNA